MVVPKGSLRRKFAGELVRLIRLSLRFFGNSERKLKSTYLLLKYRFLRSRESKKERNINIRSKKIIYIGHSYHDKTKSSAFLIDYLEQFYEVEVILDESWQGKPYPDLSFVDESYLGVVFYQNLPSKKVLEGIKNDNFTFFPMYDTSGGLDYDFWNDYHNLKIINFSKTLHNKLLGRGFESMYIQYFSKQNDFIPGYENEIFFWQRLTKININLITKLFEKNNLRIHIHRAVDPKQKFILPDKDDEEKFKITYSDWFETREQMLDVIKGKGIYIAPREFEGIGMSFLEAMAMGKAVVAVDNPTMNEYIEHNKTGYLFNLSKPERINLSNIEQIQKNAYEFMCQGYIKWEKDKHRIIDFIQSK